MSVTIRDIAKRVNLSHTTVSRALNGRNAIHIPDATRERIREVARAMGYRPNLNARALVTGRSRLVALQLFRLDAPFAMETARQLQALAWQDGYEVLAHEFLGDDANLRSAVDGVLLLDRIFRAREDVPAPEGQTPHVALGSFLNDGMDAAGVDLLPASREAMRLLLDSGRKRIAFIGRRDAFVDSVDGRVNAYSEAMDAAGQPRLFLDTPDNTRAHGRDYLWQYAERDGFPDALFCENDELAVGCYRALREAGRRIPDDVAVIGCDGIDEGRFLDPPLTTIAQPIAQMCRVGWEFLKSRMENRSRERQHTLLPATLTLRESHPP